MLPGYESETKMSLPLPVVYLVLAILALIGGLELVRRRGLYVLHEGMYILYFDEEPPRQAYEIVLHTPKVNKVMQRLAKEALANSNKTFAFTNARDAALFFGLELEGDLPEDFVTEGEDNEE